MLIEELIIQGDMPAIDAMRRLDETGRRILFIAPGGILKAVLTDSDIRKYILRGGELSRPVSEVANYSPKYLPTERRSEAREFMQKHIINALPILDVNGRIADVVFLNLLEGVGTQKVLNMPVVIMAGGLGTRLYPYTKILPKPLIPVGDVPIVERVMQKFAAFGCSEFTMIVNYRKNMIKSYFLDSPCEHGIQYVEEEQPLGTGGGLSLLQGRINETFFMSNCDILVDADYADIAKHHAKQKNDITMVCALKQFVIPYGVVELCEDGTLNCIREKPQSNHLTNTGMYVIEPHVLSQIPKDTKLGFTDIIAQCKSSGGRVGVYPIGEAGWMDMGQMEELDVMRRRFENG